MENELLDFTAQAGFQFRYRYTLTESLEREFLNDCQNVIRCAKATQTETFKTAWWVAKVKRSGAWKEVIDPKSGNTFNYLSFEKFSEYAYGLKPTATSNLLSVAEFFNYDERLDTVVFKNPRFAGMNQTQLIELAPLPEHEREYFTARISSHNMRLCKKYIKSDDNSFATDREAENFDLLSSAQAWADRKSRCADEKDVQEIDEELRKAASDPAQGDIEFYQEANGKIQATEFENAPAKIQATEFLDEQYRFTSRDKTLKFLAEIDTWETIESRNEFFDEVKRFRFRTGAELFAATCKMCVSAQLDEKALLFYFLSAGHGARAIKISKIKLVAWLRAHEAELLGVEA